MVEEDVKSLITSKISYMIYVLNHLLIYKIKKEEKIN